MWAYAPLALSKDRENDQTPLHPLVTGCAPSRNQVCTVVVEHDASRRGDRSMVLASKEKQATS
jgi:hypothetical protein